MSDFIDPEVERFARAHTEPESDLHARLREETHRVMDRPQMQVDAIEGRFLKMLVRLTGARTVLEIGMFTGYSALMMAEGLPDDGRLITCEVDPKAEEIARRYFSDSPHGHKITVRMGPALETIRTLSEPLDLVFIDADKSNYSTITKPASRSSSPAASSSLTMSSGAAKSSLQSNPTITRSWPSTAWSSPTPAWKTSASPCATE
jgi:predicted O-methyltransferase YrrM